MLFQTRKNEKLPVHCLLWGLLFLSGFLLNQSSLSADTRSPSAGSPLLDDANLHAVQFLGKNTGWAVGDRGVIRKTEDGGRTWQFVASPVDCPLKSICFLTNQIGWIAGGGTAAHGHLNQGVLLFTKDGGQTWQELVQQRLPRLHYVRFFGMDEGVVIGDSSVQHATGVFKTTDGGQTWQDVTGYESAGFRSAAFFDVNTGLVAGSQGRMTLVGGGTVLPPRFPPQGLRGLQDVQVPMTGAGWMVGDGALLRKTENRGIVWEMPETALPDQLKDFTDFKTVEVRGERIWVAGDPGSVIWHSDDRGRSWRQQWTGQSAPLASIDFVDDQNGYAVGALGTILSTDDGGRTWRSNHAAPRRVAFMCVHAQPQQVSFDLLSKYAGDQGYRSLVVLPIRRDLGSEGQKHADLDLRLNEAVTSVGGGVGSMDWRFPVQIPELEQNADRLIEEWNRHTEGRLASVTLSRFVAQLRTWRPEVLILDQPVGKDAASTLMKDAMLQAVRYAADPTRYIEHREQAGLGPWKVRKVYLRLPEGGSGNVSVDADEYLPRLGTTASTVSATGKQILGKELSSEAARSVYRLVDVDQGEQATVTGGSLFAGIGLAPGSDARRMLNEINADDEERNRQLAERQRNIRAMAAKLIDDPLFSAQLMSHLKTITQGLSRRQAALQLEQLAQQYVASYDLEKAEATYQELVEQFPREPEAVRGMLWLFQLWSSEEIAWQRNRGVPVERTRSTSNPAQAGSPVRNAFQFSEQLPSPSLETVRQVGQINTGAPENWSTQTAENWKKQALSAVRWFQKYAPAFFETPEVQIPLASLYRLIGSHGKADDIFHNFHKPEANESWRNIAKAENWLLHPADTPPRPVYLCRFTKTRPVLDGLLSDECWQDANELTLSEKPAAGMENKANAGVDPVDRAFVLLSYDNENLYIAASIPIKAGLDYPAAPDTGRGYDADLKLQDRLSLAFDIDRDYTTFYQMEIDHRGWTSDRCWIDRSWNPRWYVAREKDQQAWRTEIAIPLSELAPSTRLKRSTWGLSVVRILPAMGLQGWNHPLTVEPRPDTFGLIRFE
ncbi:YCF48-related protein [Gimesia maris]|uniref:YCF48-related protein n=1 Tax=Gimesia maris TaxID=122 RepID=UPI0024204965|nr:YCF48-related protein [Gimesia maris]|tara:strand:- start:189519 stop:192704 length:3186 start_codon:yes stop_codon:yes gene_type:complete